MMSNSGSSPQPQHLDIILGVLISFIIAVVIIMLIVIAVLLIRRKKQVRIIM